MNDFTNKSNLNLNNLDKLKGQSISSSAWKEYDAKTKGGNENNIFDESEIAAIKNDINKAILNKGSLEDALESIFVNNKTNLLKAEISLMNIEPQQNLVKQDKTYVKKSFIENILDEQKINESFEKLQEKFDKKLLKDGRQAYKAIFRKYKPSNLDKYNQIVNYIQKNQGYNNKIPKIQAEEIAKMVCSLSEQYGINPEITTYILQVETGGYVFDDQSMGVNSNIYNGVMQVDLTTIKSMYAKTEDYKNSKLPNTERRIAFDHRYFENNEERINELKQIYKTPQDLYMALEQDVALGVEVGIIAYKGKLSMFGGDTKKAMKGYTGGNYTFPENNTIETRIWPIPEYDKSKSNLVGNKK